MSSYRDAELKIGTHHIERIIAYMEPGDQGNIRAPELPQDGYEWKKYGQKFIRNIGKFRYVHTHIYKFWVYVVVV